MTTRLGPGKFESSGAIGQLLYRATGDGWAAEEAGSVTETGLWCGRINLGTDAHKDLREQFPEEWEELDAEDRADLAGAAGAIICEDDQGFVYADLYPTKKALDEAWTEQESRAEPDESAEDEDFGSLRHCVCPPRRR